MSGQPILPHVEKHPQYYLPGGDLYLIVCLVVPLEDLIVIYIC